MLYHGLSRLVPLPTCRAQASNCADQALTTNGKVVERTWMILLTSAKVMTEWVLVPRLAHCILLSFLGHGFNRTSCILNILAAHIIQL